MSTHRSRRSKCNARARGAGGPPIDIEKGLRKAQPIRPDPWRFLVDSGLLFEINRMVLHPLGFALAVDAADDGGVVLAGLIDHSDDPEGMIFSAKDFADGNRKILRYLAKGAARRSNHRLRALGFVRQGEKP